MIQSTLSNSRAPDFRLAEDIFGQDFEVWAYDQRWHRVRTNGQRWPHASVDYYVELIDRLNEACRASTVQMQSLSDGRVLCLLPLREQAKKTVALRIYDRQQDFEELAQRAVAAALLQQKRAIRVRAQLLESDSRLAAWSARISQGNAELAWLHELSVSTELSGTEDSPLNVAKRILPEMCRLTRARSVVYVDEPNNDGNETDELKTWQTGDECVPLSVVLSLIGDAGDLTGGPPVIRNYSTPVHGTSHFAGVLSCIVKAVPKGTDRIGWIVVVNKDLQYLFQHDFTEISPTALERECEFGHFESGLVEAAANAISAHARNASLLRQKQALFEGAIRSLVNAIDAKDSYTCGHSDRVAEYAREIARTMKMDDTFCDQIYMTGLMHDVGKIGVPDHVLQKPGRLTTEEFDQIKEHPTIGHEILKDLGEFEYVLPGVLHHHEAVDGSGYPFGLSGTEIPLMARILAVADAYDAMTSDRPYRSGMASEKAEQIIRDGAGRQWDSDCVEAFNHCLTGLKAIGSQRHGLMTVKPGP